MIWHNENLAWQGKSIHKPQQVGREAITNYEANLQMTRAGEKKRFYSVQNRGNQDLQVNKAKDYALFEIDGHGAHDLGMVIRDSSGPSLLQ